MLTVKELIESIVNDSNVKLSSDTLERLVTVAYYMGRETATREVSDLYMARICAQEERARECRYHNLAREIIGDTKPIWRYDYRQEVMNLFGGDETRLAESVTTRMGKVNEVLSRMPSIEREMQGQNIDLNLTEDEMVDAYDLFEYRMQHDDCFMSQMKEQLDNAIYSVIENKGKGN